MFTVPPTENVLRRLDDLPRYSGIMQLFRSQTEVMRPARYFKRRARRLREYGFTPEDAAVLALGSFGTTDNTDVLGAHFVVTFDQPMIRLWVTRQSEIRESLATMQRNLSQPYRHALLPRVCRPEQALASADAPVPRQP
ncbi:MAG: hypothetical protein COZ06_07730 [Armatimonadetes bacterium CG_4_10_14_3_um_filter_66_18]|nr:hypothetical protein [Armatimonadota bacterium]PIY50757.1 MAG: hypothetical protein COZ06_07730 [Armatimonadetes bacterium CG_4_10_14_3_um_filter_66_18]